MKPIDATTIFSIIATALFVAASLWWEWTYVFKPRRDRERVLGGEDDALLKEISNDLELLHELFGNNVSLRTFHAPDGRSVGVVCPKCDQVNRLIKGFRGARCGKCRRPLVLRSVAASEKEVRLN